MWKTKFPKQGDWFNMHNLLSVSVIDLWLQENYRSTFIKALTYFGLDMRKWRLSSKARIKTFCAYIRNGVGTDKLKVRIQYKPRH